MITTVTAGNVETAEVHGQLIGTYCMQGDAAVTAWLTAMQADLPVSPAAESVDELATEARKLVGKVGAGQLEFELLLPDDETPLPERVGALARWCQGYLYGLAQGGLRQIEGLPGDCTEILQDFAQLTTAHVDRETGEADEPNERDLFELTEYVRVGVQLVHEELNTVDQAKSGQTH